LIFLEDLVLFITLCALLLLVYSSIVNGISPTPSSRKQIREIVRAVPEGFSGKMYELGSGWGTLAVSLAKAFPECRITGVENSVVPYLFSKLLLRILRIPHVNLRFANFVRIDINDADLIICYLYTGGMRKLKPKFESELKPGTIVISNTFSIPGWSPIEVHRANDLFHSPIYVYEVAHEPRPQS
jgi:hypothetical protein